MIVTRKQKAVLLHKLRMRRSKSDIIEYQKLFCLETLPKKPLTKYIWKDSEVWNDSLVWID